MSRFYLIAGVCVTVAIALWFVVIAFPAESGKPWGGVAAVAMVAPILVGLASALLARRHR